MNINRLSICTYGVPDDDNERNEWGCRVRGSWSPHLHPGRGALHSCSRSRQLAGCAGNPCRKRWTTFIKTIFKKKLTKQHLTNNCIIGLLIDIKWKLRWQADQWWLTKENISLFLVLHDKSTCHHRVNLPFVITE